MIGMDAKTRRELNTRNKIIIEAILSKMQSSCLGTIDLIGIAGSFITNTFYEKSDLDLLIIKNSDEAKKLNTCFILEDVAHDIYCSAWDRLEKMAEYNDPHVSKLFKLKVVYKKNSEVIEKYKELRDRAEIEMRDAGKTFEKSKSHFDTVMREYGEVMVSMDLEDCLIAVSKMVLHIEYMIYMLNGTYIKKGIKGIPKEIGNMSLLPKGFIENYEKIFHFNSVDKLKTASTVIVKILKKFMDEQNNKLESQKEISSQDLTGTYEEIYSNWKNKMHYASKTNDLHLSFMTMASCQKFYDEMAQTFSVPKIALLGKYDPNNLYKTSGAFHEAMDEWKELYDKLKKPVKRYKTVDEFTDDYLNK